MYLFAFVCPETDDSSGMVSCLFGNVLLQIAISYRCFVSKRLVDFNNKVVLEVFGNSTAVACSVADNLVLFGNYFDSNYLIISKLYFFCHILKSLQFNYPRFDRQIVFFKENA